MRDCAPSQDVQNIEYVGVGSGVRRHRVQVPVMR
jgi:hypothetical protein